jgi:MFS-type transporter involved in bile tolerance (Atg22 family)
LKGPHDKHKTVLFGIGWGIALAWLQPQHTTAFVPIIPKGQEAELMGMYLLSGQILSWLPPAVFTLLNELGLPMSLGLGSLSFFFFAGFIFLCLMGDYHLAVAIVQPTDAVELSESSRQVVVWSEEEQDSRQENHLL